MDATEERLRRIVEEGKGRLVGHQDEEDLIYFNDVDPRYGATLALRPAGLTPKRVWEKILSKRVELQTARQRRERARDGHHEPAHRAAPRRRRRRRV